jgi:hypothetical protein
MTAARDASPEGWQVSVRFSLVGVKRGGLEAWPVAEGGSANGRVVIWFGGAAVGVGRWGRGGQC